VRQFLLVFYFFGDNSGTIDRFEGWRCGLENGPVLIVVGAARRKEMVE
jgi:hypothetical protein